ncbi:MAG TPA: hypothetical protein VN937_17665 [Blastocatellia bacterium]|nr:hypothetical protein [Blastocatellia bacterium]
MSQANQALTDAFAAAERLPLKLQRHLAEQLLARTARKQTTITVYLQRLPHEQQKRIAELMDKCNEGKLSRSEQMELTRLGSEVDELMLANSVALARALRPELFDTKGRPIASRIRQAARQQSSRNGRTNRRAKTHK